MTSIANLDDLLGTIGDLHAAPTLAVLIERLEQALSGHRVTELLSPDPAVSVPARQKSVAACADGLGESDSPARRTTTAGVHEIIRIVAELATNPEPPVPVPGPGDRHFHPRVTTDGFDDQQDARVVQLLAVAFQARFDELFQSTYEDMTLTPRERDVLRWFASGKSAEDVATILHISSGTVMFHYRRAADRLGTLNRTHTVVEALRRGLIPMNPAG